HARPAEAAANVLHDIVRSRGREREDRRPSELRHSLPDLEISRPEVVPPTRDAVRLVDDEQVDLRPLERAPEPGLREALGRREDELRTPLHDVAQGLAFF